MTETVRRVTLLGMGKTYVGKPCTHGHGAIRYTANGACVVCNANRKKEAVRKKIEAGTTRHLGKVCDKHPDLNGERMVSGSHCVGCLKEKSRALQKRNGYPVMRRQIERVTSAVFSHYGSECVKCGENDRDVLTIDHTDQNGNKHLSASGNRYRGVHLYRWLVNHGFPEGFRVLCASCNMKAYKMYRRGEEF